ncbi:SDR family NAD(P)-dependent oxidoreductase [Kitasatospora sp. GAS1066B]|uniref:type I polyketide synthase n=1 Tax=Kitasatospora sp. GAS1066B TaxID=3156271 RepID=UPI003514D55B
MSEYAEPIAIIGIAGRFPGAGDVDQYWRNLCEGRESVHRPSDDELLALGVSHEVLADPDYVKAVALAPDVDKFDAAFFGLTPREAQLCHPQMRLLLETAHAAFENAGYAPGTVTDVGVFASGGANRYGALEGKTESALRSASGISLAVLNNTDYVATLVSYKFGFQGPSFTVQTACSSSLVATHLAVQALRNGECEIALAGGADVEFPLGHGHWWAPGSPLSKEGRVRPFDRDADGTIFGSGVGVVALKRLSDALADGDNIRAVIRSSAVNNDGSDKIGFSAPSMAGQSAVISEAMLMAGVEPSDISYVESHGTGTPLGDLIEVAALNDAYRSLADGHMTPGSIALSSVKGNIGHLGHAAGSAALIKMVLALENERIPASINFSEPNPKAEFDRSPFFVNDTLQKWERADGKPRRSAVHSLGIGGTNVHMVLEEAPLRDSAETDHRPRLVVWSGRTPQAEQEYRSRLAAHLAGAGEELFADTVLTMQHGRKAEVVRSAVVASSAAESAAALRGVPGAPAVVTGSAEEPRPVAFLFPGQGSQHAAMAAGLHGVDRVFTQSFDECLALLDEAGAAAGSAWREATEDEELQRTELAQPLLFAVEWALSRMWQSWGVRPERLLGHSIGELTAATVAGVFELADAARLVAARAGAMAAMPAGAMLAVSAAPTEIEDLLPPAIGVAVVNGPRQTVVAGPKAVLDDFARLLAERGIRTKSVRTSHAFHSEAMAPAAEEFRRSFEGIVLRAPEIPLYSAASGGLLTEAQAVDPDFWADQLTTPVWFGRALDGMLAEGPQLLLEVGPQQALAGLAKPHREVTQGRSAVVASLPHLGAARGDWESLLAAAAVLWTEGHPLDWARMAQQETWRRTVVPGYPYQRTRHWVETPAERSGSTEAAAAAVVNAVVGHEEAGREEPEHEARPLPFYTLSWTEQPRGSGSARGGATTALALLPEDRSSAGEVAAALQRAGLRVIPVTPGEAYRETAVGFRIRRDSTEDIERVFTALARRGSYPRLVVHAATLGAWAPPTVANAPGQTERSFHSVLAFVQQGARRAAGNPVPGLLVLTDRSVDVSGGEQVDAVKATLHGLVRTLAVEEPGTACKLIDLGRGVPEEDLTDELADWSSHEVVALRGDRRWVRSEQQFVPESGTATAFRPGGSYLITGGLGGLGLEVAKGIVRTGLRPHLLLLGRTGLAEVEEPHRVPDGADERTTRLRAGLEEIEELGASYRIVTADLSDPAALRAALAEATGRRGPIAGVLHLAGVAGDGMMQFRTRQQAEAVLAPKVLGSLALAEAFADRPSLDFFVAFSSTAALRGLRGSGDYAAANCFLDAFAATQLPFARRALTINWPAWNSVGMAVPGLAKQTEATAAVAGPVWRAALTPSECPMLDEHRINGEAVLPGTGHLDFVVRAFRAQVLDGAATPVRLTEVVFRTPLVVHDSRTMEIAFTPGDDVWQFVVRSFAGTRAVGDVQVHATGTVESAAGTARQLDLDTLRVSLSDRRERGEPERRLVEFGPRWSNVTEVGSGPADPGEILVRLDLPEAFAAEATEHELHPALLDNATAFARDPERDAPHLPFMYRSVVVYDRLPARIYSHIRRGSGADGLIVADIDVVAPDGRLLVEIEGFAMRRVEDGFVVGDTPVAEVDEPRAPGRPEADATSGQTGIDPETGVGLLLELIGARTPRQVAVARFRDGVPVLSADARRVPVVARPAVEALPVPAGTPEHRAAAVPTPVPTLTLEALPQAAEQSTVDTMRELWTDALGIPDIGPGDDFFTLGGNSLTAVDLITRIRARYRIDLSIAVLFEYPTLGALAEELRSLGAG